MAKGKFSNAVGRLGLLPVHREIHNVALHSRVLASRTVV